jgi:peptide/nickel transport system permease protein
LLSDRVRKRIGDHYYLRTVFGGLKAMLRDRTTLFYFSILMAVLITGVVGPTVAPYEISETQYGEDGEILRAAPPSAEHPLGTTAAGYDVASRLLVGARPTAITGALAAAMIVSIGTTIGIVAGYMGGRVETVLMRFTDFAYGLPLIPTAIVLVTLIGFGFIQSIVVIGLVVWRGAARVIRAQTLRVKQYPYVRASKATGASDLRIILKHILPNVAPMSIFFLAFGVGWAIMIQASLTFLGVASPFIPSWGVMIRNAFQAGYTAAAPWWSMMPGVLLGTTVVSTFMFGRGYEELIDVDTEEAIAA